MITMKPESRELLGKARTALAALGLDEYSLTALWRAELCEEQHEEHEMSWEQMVEANAEDSRDFVVDQYRDALAHLDGVEDDEG